MSKEQPKLHRSLKAKALDRGGFVPPDFDPTLKPTNPSHGELLDAFVGNVAIQICESVPAATVELNKVKAAELRSLILGKMGEGEKLAVELEQARKGQKHTQDWYASHYGKLQDWARTRLPEPFVDEFFSCIANGSWHYSDSNYFKLDTAQEQILHDQSTRAENAELRAERAEARLAAQPDVWPKFACPECGGSVYFWYGKGSETVYVSCQDHPHHRWDANDNDTDLGKFFISAHLAPQAGVGSTDAEPLKCWISTCEELCPERNACTDKGCQLYAPPASHTPRCPKCGSENLLSWPAGHPQQVSCVICHEPFKCRELSDFAQFFPVTSSQGGAEGRQSPLGNFAGTGREGIQVDEEQE